MIGAFFDIDGTLYRNSLMIEHFNKLVKYEILDQSLWHSGVKDAFIQWRKRVGDFEDYLHVLIDIYINALKGKKKESLEFIANQVIDLHGDVVYRYTRSCIEKHKKSHHKVIFISGAPDFLVSRMAAKYGIDDFIGSLYKLDLEGRFTGEVVPMWDEISKNKAVDDFCTKYNLDLNNSYAYGDTNGDISMLRKVGNPTAINPTMELVNLIKNDQELVKRIKIIVERKDVIYSIAPDVETISID